MCMFHSMLSAISFSAHRDMYGFIANARVDTQRVCVSTKRMDKHE